MHPPVFLRFPVAEKDLSSSAGSVKPNPAVYSFLNLDG